MRLRMLAAIILGAIFFGPDLAARATPPANPGNPYGNGPFPIIELRQYRLYPGKRDVLIDLFEHYFVESQEAVGMHIVGTFRDLDRPNNYTWIRAFHDMPARALGLTSFYYGPVWQSYRTEANPLLEDNDDILLLHAVEPASGFAPAAAPRAPVGATEIPRGLVVATIYTFKPRMPAEFPHFFARQVKPELSKAGIPVLASFVTEKSRNNFPQLNIRDKDHVFVWFARFDDPADYERHKVALTQSNRWTRQVSPAVNKQTQGEALILRLEPTARSELH